MSKPKTKARYKLEDQARRFFLHHYSGFKKNKKEAPNKIRSQATFIRHIETTAFALEQLGLKKVKQLTPELALEYLQMRKSQLCPKALQNERRVLERVVFLHTPEQRLVIQSNLPPREWVNRAYTHAQIYQLMSHQSPQNQLATALCFTAGLRAQELLTLQRANETTVSQHRSWRNDLFIGLEGQKYIVKGKGGLRRAVMIPHFLAEQLEKHRLEIPRNIKDRKCNITSYYDITGGKSFSDAFSQLSIRVFGWSHGAHGLRYCYAQERLNCSIPNQHYEDSLEIVSQELGHFRKSITPHYLHRGTCS